MNAPAALSEETRKTEEAVTPAWPNKYCYPEFAGWGGERYLKKLLRQILPMALYRTWEIFADHQAPDNECYLGVTRLAEIAGRATRTIEKNLAELCAKHLLTERVERKCFRGPDGMLKSRAVVVKDFSGLYALAHEYHEWLHAEEYVEADRELIELVKREPVLVEKLRRFENYRRAFYHRPPGPSPIPREKDRWFAEYEKAAFVKGDNEGAKSVESLESGAPLSKYSSRDMTKHLPEDSAERITQRSQRKLQPGESPDSESSSSTKTSLQKGERSASGIRRRDRHPAISKACMLAKQEEKMPLSPATSLPSGEKVLSAPLPNEQEESARSRTAIAPTNRVKAESNRANYPVRSKHESEEQTDPGQMLARTFLNEIARPFGDLNPQGSATRVLSIIQNARMEQTADVLACLVRAYVVARDTRTIRPEHCHPQTGQANRMPLFCAMFQRFAEMRTRDGQCWDYSRQQVEDTLTADERLARWWKKQQHQVDKLESWQAEEGNSEQCSQHTSPDEATTLPPVEQDSWQETALLAAPMPAHRKRRSRLSQTEEEREERAALARKVRTRLFKMSVPIQDPIVLWEHLTCGCPLYHTRQGKEVCALCYPDLAWPEEARTLIRSIMEPQAIESTQETMNQC